MSDHDLRDVARDLERQVPLPDFELVAARGRQIRRRRRALQVAASGSALCAAVAIGVGLARVPGREPAQEPAAPRTDRPGTAAGVLGDRRAAVDDASTVVSDTGAVLQRVRIPSGDPCAGSSSAWVWTPWEGAARTWSDRVGGRTAAAVGEGFVVGGPDPTCGVPRSDTRAGAYVVDAAGRRTAITWHGRAERACAADPVAAQCLVDVPSATGRLRVAPLQVRPSASAFPVSATGGVLWARSVDSRTLHWSTDGGSTWQSHRTSLPAADDVQASAAGRWALFFGYPDAELTRDGGRTWQRWEGDRPLLPFVVANELVVVSADGDLLVVSHRAGRRPELLASTDDTWRRFERTDVRTRFGTVSPQAAGTSFWVPDRGRTWVSPDGRSWRTVAPPRG